MGSYSIFFCLLEFQRIAKPSTFNTENSKDFDKSKPLDSYITYVFLKILFSYAACAYEAPSQPVVATVIYQHSQLHWTEGKGLEFSLQGMINKTNKKVKQRTSTVQCFNGLADLLDFTIKHLFIQICVFAKCGKQPCENSELHC